MKINAFRIHDYGGPEVLHWETVEIGEPGPREVCVRHKAVGLNFIDTYHRSGLYPLTLPSGIGLEAAGVVETVGSEVDEWKPGDRVAYCHAPIGAYAEAHIVSANMLVAVPDGISDELAAGMILKGLTAAYLLFKTYPLKNDDSVLWHAAAGGVGLIASQWAKHLGARVIGTAGSEEKAALAKLHGCDEVILYRQEDVAPTVRAFTDGRGVDVVYDSVGKDTFEASLDSLRQRGMMVSFGNASGPAPDVSPLTLAQKGSLFLTRPILAHYISDPEELRELAGLLFDAVTSGAISIDVNQRYALKDAARAHQDLEARKTTGSTVLIP